MVIEIVCPNVSSENFNYISKQTFVIFPLICQMQFYDRLTDWMTDLDWLIDCLFDWLIFLDGAESQRCKSLFTPRLCSKYMYIPNEPRIGWLLRTGIRVIQFTFILNLRQAFVLVIPSTAVMILFIRNYLNVKCNKFFIWNQNTSIVHREAKETQHLHLSIELSNGWKDFVQIKCIWYNWHIVYISW